MSKNKTVSENQNLLKRKIDSAAKRHAKAALQNSLVTDLEKSIAKVFLTLLHDEVSASVCDSSIKSSKNAIEDMGACLFGILDAYGGKGLAGFDLAFINAITALLMGAKNAGGKPAEERPISQTDASLSAMVINAILAEAFFGTNPQPQNSPIPPAFGMNGHKLVKAPLFYMLFEDKYAFLRIEISNKNNDSYGQIELILPLSCIATFTSNDTNTSAMAEREIWRDTMQTIATISPLEFETVLQHMPIPLGEVLGFKIGDTLDLPDGSLEHLILEAQTQSGPLSVFDGQLGALKTKKAFRVSRRLHDETAPAIPAEI
ncbi:MAG: hypothetical protein V3V13_06340 [Paracoccaceae bacterium]